MAKKPKYIVLSKENQKKVRDLISGITDTAGVKDFMLDEIGATGQLSPGTAASFGLDQFRTKDINDRLAEYFADVPATGPTQTSLKEKLKEQLIDEKKQPISEADLTDEELSTRKEIYESLHGLENPLDRQTLNAAVHQKLERKSTRLNSSHSQISY